MRAKHYYLYLTADERMEIIQSLIQKRNGLIKAGKYTDAVDDLLCKFTKARKKKVVIH